MYIGEDVFWWITFRIYSQEIIFVRYQKRLAHNENLATRDCALYCSVGNMKCIAGLF